MKIKISDLSKKLSKYNVLTNFGNNDLSEIDSIRYLTQDSAFFNESTLYIVELSKINSHILNDGPINLLIVSGESPEVSTIFSGKNQNIIHIFENDISTVFNEVLDILLDIQKLSNDTSLLMEALSSGEGIDHIVEVGSKLLGNPFFIRDINYKILSFTKNVEVNDGIWKELTEKGYQSYLDFQYLMKHGFIELVNKVKIPIYNKIVDSEDNELLLQGSHEIEIFSNFKYLLYPRYDRNEKVSFSRVWCKIMSSENNLGELVVLEAFKTFSDYDFALIKILSNTLSLELQKNNSYDKSVSKKQDLVLKDLLDQKIKDLDSLEEQLKITNLKFKSFLKIIVFETNQQDESGMPLNYIKGFLSSVFGEVFCFFYEEYLVALYTSKRDNTFDESQLNQLFNFSKDAGMSCGVSRSFTNLLDGRKHFFQSVEAINSGKRLDKERLIYFFEDYVLQHMFNVYSKNESLQSLCLPALLVLINYDESNNTDYYKTLCSYVMKFKNPSDLALDLNVHRNTLYYRLNKIEEIMNVNLNNIDILFNIYMSIKILEYTGKTPK